MGSGIRHEPRELVVLGPLPVGLPAGGNEGRAHPRAGLLRLPRKCRNGHEIKGPQDEKTSGHRQCLKSRRESQDLARAVWIDRWWLTECGFTKEHAKAIQLASRAAWNDYWDDHWDYDKVEVCDTFDNEEGWRLAKEAEQAEAAKYPEGAWRSALPR